MSQEKGYVFETDTKIGKLLATSETDAATQLIEAGYKTFELFESVGKFKPKVEVVKIEEGDK